MHPVFFTNILGIKLSVLDMPAALSFMAACAARGGQACLFRTNPYLFSKTQNDLGLRRAANGRGHQLAFPSAERDGRRRSGTNQYRPSEYPLDWIGSALAFYTGVKRQAPCSMQRAGLACLSRSHAPINFFLMYEN